WTYRCGVECSVQPRWHTDRDSQRRWDRKDLGCRIRQTVTDGERFFLRHWVRLRLRLVCGIQPGWKIIRNSWRRWHRPALGYDDGQTSDGIKRSLSDDFPCRVQPRWKTCGYD